jgi:hypothetical protein
METQKEVEKEFGEFGEIAIRNCFICGKTVRKSSCYEYERNPASVGSGAMSSSYRTKHSICLKCLLKGFYGICKDKKEMNKYIDLFIKTSIVEDLNKIENQKV